METACSCHLHSFANIPLCILQWGSIISDKNDKELWRWDKREYTGGLYGNGPKKLVLIDEPPAWDADAGYHLQDGVKVEIVSSSFAQREYHIIK